MGRQQKGNKTTPPETAAATAAEEENTNAVDDIAEAGSEEEEDSEVQAEDAEPCSREVKKDRHCHDHSPMLERTVAEGHDHEATLLDRRGGSTKICIKSKMKCSKAE